MIEDIQWMAEADLNTIDPEAYDFDFILDLFFDNLQLEKPEQQLGCILRNDTEAEIIKRLTDAVRIVRTNVGRPAPDIEYLEDEAWSQVVETAKAALAVLNRAP